MMKHLGILFLFFCATSFASVVPVTPTPLWVKTKPITLDAKVPRDDVRNGVYYLIVDKQNLIEKNGQRHSFRHYATLILTSEGLEQESQVNIVYDPNYQTIVLHKLVVWRDGIAHDKTKSAQMMLLQREENLEQLIYDGSTTLNILLNDTRINDVIEYSYTVKGSNPIFSRSVSFASSLNWTIPVEELFIRVLWNKDETLHHDIKNSSLKLQQNTLAIGTEYWVEDHQIRPVLNEANMPSWFSPHGLIVFSDINDWKQVISWGVSLFDGAIKTSPEVREIAQNVIKSTPDKALQISKLLLYVQNEVRYLGIEFGVNSHLPSNATETLNRHYGDCKDKTALLISLLKEIDINAYPALVNTETGQDLNNYPPRYTAFDHVITVAELNGKSYWIDPTRLNQSGTLQNIFQPDYGYALVLNNKNHDLTKVKIEQPDSQIVTHEVFKLEKDTLSAKYSISTQYKHLDSELVRGRIINKSISETRTDYLGFYKNYFPSIRVDSAATFDDSLESNVVTINESYIIDEFWDKNEEDQKFYANFYSNLISPTLDAPGKTERDFPLKISHPTSYTQNIDVYFTEDNWSFDTDSFIEDNPFFYYQSNVNFSAEENKLTLKYHYQSKVAFIKPENLGSYIAALEKLEDQARYGIFKHFDSPAVLSSQDESTISEPNIIYFLLSIYLFLLVTAFVLWRLDVAKNKHDGEMQYFPVSVIKFLIYWSATFGFYAMYWNYKNWKFIKQRDSLHIMPFARGVFYPLWFYPLYNVLLEDSKKFDSNDILPGKAIASLMALAIIFLELAGRHYGLDILSLVLSAALIIPLVRYINFKNREFPSAIAYNSQWKVRNFFTLILCMPLMVLSFGSEIGILPSDSVINGDRILSYDTKFLQRKNVIEPQDKIIMFYSDAFLSIREDGNGFTKRHVFSYWKEEGVFYYESALMQDIDKVEVTWAPTAFDNTIIKITKNNGSSFLLYVSSTDKKDKLFTRKLNEVRRLQENATES